MGYGEQVLEENQRIKKELYMAKEQYKRIIEAVPTGIIIHCEGRIVLANPEAAKIIGVESPEALIGKPVIDFISDKRKKVDVKPIGQKVVTLKDTPPFEEEFVRLDGKIIAVRLTAISYEYMGKPAVQVFFNDITKQKEAEKKLKENYKALQRTWENTIRAMADIVEIRDPYTARHQKQVAKLASKIAKEMCLPEQQRRGLVMASYIHDIGKIYVPGEFLTKTGKLESNELNIIKNHSQAGYNILKNIDFKWPISEIVLQHHERMDGSGYPRGLSGEDILIEARILAVADVVEAIASHRPYRPSLGTNKALEEITKGKGILFDSEVVDACLKLFIEKGLKLNGYNDDMAIQETDYLLEI